MAEGSVYVGSDKDPIEIDTSKPHAARVYDYLVGGTTNFPADREAAEYAFSAFPGGVDVARANARASRSFLGRSTRCLTREAGVRQFLDIGTGIPTTHNTHEIAQATAPESRILYVDNDPIVLAHAHTLMRGTVEGKAVYLQLDLRDPDTVMTEASRTLDFERPIGLMLVSILHLIPDEDRPYEIVAGMLEALPSGSYLAIAHLASDIEPEAMRALSDRLEETEMEERPALRSRAEVARFFDGLEMVEPGLVTIDEWRPEGGRSQEPGLVHPFWAGVARKP